VVPAITNVAFAAELCIKSGYVLTGKGQWRPQQRFEVSEAAQIFRMSRAQLYNRIHDGSLRPQKDGARTYITRAELERYVETCGVSHYAERRRGTAPDS
jgi:excisionase family DNA binding protein